jgi:hypothetical protein
MTSWTIRWANALSGGLPLCSFRLAGVQIRLDQQAQIARL